jgi:hypothetical protein
VSSWTWPDFDPVAFFWSDVARRHDRFAHDVGVTFTQP